MPKSELILSLFSQALFCKEWLWAICSRLSWYKSDGSDLLFFTSKSLFPSFPHKKLAICPKTDEQIPNPVKIQFFYFFIYFWPVFFLKFSRKNILCRFWRWKLCSSCFKPSRGPNLPIFPHWTFQLIHDRCIWFSWSRETVTLIRPRLSDGRQLKATKQGRSQSFIF